MYTLFVCTTGGPSTRIGALITLVLSFGAMQGCRFYTPTAKTVYKQTQRVAEIRKNTSRDLGDSVVPC